MKTKEVIFYEATGRQFHRFAFGPAILDAMQLYSDQQNKELREKVKALDDHRIKIEEMELAERNRANKAKAEIQRLTKEVEELNIKLNGTVAYNTGLQSENTRFRELLVRSNDLISDYEHRFSEFDPNKRDLLVRDIDNALNPKP